MSKEQSLKFWVKVANQTAVSAAQLAKCILLHASAHTTVAPSCERTSKNFILLTQQAGITVFLLIN